MNTKLVTAEIVAKRFAVGVGTVNRWVRDGVIPCIRPTRRIVRFDLAEVEQAVRINPIPTPTPEARDEPGPQPESR